MSLRGYMRVLVLLLFVFVFNVSLYSQNNNKQNNNSNNTNNTRTNGTTENANSNALLTISKFDAMKNPVSFINVVNFTPYAILLEYAKTYGIETYPYDREADLRARIIKRQVNVQVERTSEESEIKTVSRNAFGGGGGRVRLVSADYVERYAIKEADEEIIFLYGNVALELYGNTLSSDKVVYSLKTGEIFAQGNLRVQSAENDLQGEWFMLNRESRKGVLFSGTTKYQSFTVAGDIIKFNDENFYADKSSVSFSRLTPVAHDFLASRVYVWDSRKFMVFNGIYRVGSQPVFYFPLFFQNYMGTGIITTFGQSLREGVYMQNSKTFNLYGMEHTIRFDAYQKLGFLLGDEIRYTSQYHDLSLDAMFALGRQNYLLDSYISSSVGFGTRYVNYFDDGKAGKFKPRYKFEYDHTIQLYNGQNINSYVTGRLNLNSDLYFRSDFYNQRPAMDITSFFTALRGNLDDIGDSYPESSLENSIYFNNSIYGLSLRAGAQWDLSSVRNLSVSKNTNFDYYMSKPGRLVLPSIEASYSSVWGDETSYYFQNLNINYSLGVGYNRTINYRTSEGIYFYDNPELNDQLNEKIAERNNLNLYGNMSRSFTNEFVRFTPNARLDYNYQKSVNPSAEDIIYDRNSTYLGLGTTMNLSIFLPRSVIPYQWDNYFTPTITWESSYSLGYRFKEMDAESTNAGAGGEFNSHDINSRLSIGGTGYSLFYIPNLNLDVQGYVRTGYDMKPYYNAETKSYKIDFSTNKMLTTEVGGSTRLYIDQSYINYNIGKNLLGTNLTANNITTLFHIPIPIGKITDLILLRHGKRPFFGDGVMNSFELFFDISYNHDFINYRYNTVSFIFGIEFEILNEWRVRFSTTSENNRAYRYIKSYAEKENETWVNPFQDIIDSFNFKNSQKRMASLFKLSSIETSIWHDLDGWEFLATFSVRPSTLPYDVASGSVKGSYWEKEFWIEFTLTDFPGGGLPRREYDLNKTITDLQESVTNSSFTF